MVNCSNCLVLGSIGGVNGATTSTRVGIGTANPSQALEVSGGIGFSTATVSATDKKLWAPADGLLRWVTHTAASNHAFEVSHQDVDIYWHLDTTFNSYYNGPANFGIGTSAPDQKLTVNGNASKSAGGTTWAVFSDERLKNIKGHFTSGLGVLMQLQPIRFEYKPDNALGLKGDGESVGFSAQSVEKVLPEAVSQTERGYLQLNSDPILWTMLNSIKELKGENDTLKAQNAKLLEQTEALKKLVCLSHPDAELCKSGKGQDK